MVQHWVERPPPEFKSCSILVMNEPMYVIPPKALGLPCPCCHYLTLEERGGYEICPVCFWEDDGQDDSDAAAIRGGPNGNLSLTKARENFRAFGASDSRSIRSVRGPYQFERP